MNQARIQWCDRLSLRQTQQKILSTQSVHRKRHTKSISVSVGMYSPADQSWVPVLTASPVSKQLGLGSQRCTWCWGSGLNGVSGKPKHELEMSTPPWPVLAHPLASMVPATPHPRRLQWTQKGKQQKACCFCFVVRWFYDRRFVFLVVGFLWACNVHYCIMWCARRDGVCGRLRSLDTL